MRRLLFLFSALGLAALGCQCFVPVDECFGSGCALVDGGVSDAGADAGRDGGQDAGVDAGVTECAVWDGGGVGLCAALTGWTFHGTTCKGQCVDYPIVTSGVHPTLADCTSCGCDPAKLSNLLPGPPVSPSSYCDDLVVVTNLPRLINDVVGDAGCQPIGAIDFSCVLWRGQLGDAGYARACQATLIPNVSAVRCRVFAP